MTQPKFAPIEQRDEVRPSFDLGSAKPWTPHRPSEHTPGVRPGGSGFGVPGPDQGYALKLAQHVADRLVLDPGEHQEEVLCAAVVIGLRRAALFQRAPVLGDLEVGLELFGCFASAPNELVALRERLFSGLSHDYRAQRELAYLIPEVTLRQSVEQVRGDRDAWRRIGRDGVSSGGG